MTDTDIKTQLSDPFTFTISMNSVIADADADADADVYRDQHNYH